MAEVATYDPKSVVASLGGVPIVGFANDTFISIEKQEPGFTLVTGADGQVMRTKSRNNQYVVTITLLQSSPSNAYLSAVYLSDQLGTNGAGLAALAIADLQGASKFLEPFATIEMPATQEFGSEGGSREWRFLCPDPTNIVGGN